MAKSFKKFADEIKLVEDYKGNYISGDLFLPDIKIQKVVRYNKNVWEITINGKNYGECDKKSEIPESLQYSLKHFFDIEI